MKAKLFTMLLTVMMTMTLSAQEKTRSYFCQQINAPVSTGPTATLNQSTFVEWFDNGNTIRMMVGMPGFAVQMNAFYKYIGEGRQPAIDWMNGRY